MIDNYRNEADKFHTLKEITLAEAKAIWELKWGFLTLTWLEKLSPESFGGINKIRLMNRIMNKRINTRNG